jgi:TonB family protein
MDYFKSILAKLAELLREIAKEFRGFLSRNRYGVMGTIAFHMLLLIILLSFKLNTRREFVEPEIFIDIPLEVAEQIAKEEEEKIEKELEEKKSEISESVDELLKSIAVNQNVKKNNSDPKKNVQDMIDEIQKNLDQYGSDIVPGGGENLGEFKKDSLNALNEKEKQRMLDSLQSIEYSGPSSVYYSLKDRHKVYLPIPVFKCENSGKVVVQIKVNQAGKVINAKIVEKESDNDNSLWDAALTSSRRSRFNVSSSAPNQQVGTITYHFVKQ